MTQSLLFHTIGGNRSEGCVGDVRLCLAVADAWPGRAFDQADQLVAPVALRSGELDEFVDVTEYCSALGCAGDGDTATASELEF